MTFAGHNKGKHYCPGRGFVVGIRALRVMIGGGPGRELKCPYCFEFTRATSSSGQCRTCDAPWFKKNNGTYIFTEPPQGRDEVARQRRERRGTK
ncbi:MAG: hypothetical protein COA96_16850 [SAR86 cluster bacterium]|uniref:Uncharacterized protein n=1 Tax=SAR86 cluster bacterium TaxID=2030880 RepID=A0A2A5AG28_9GAMM|nr:MAG: hypothetical protein COA96_16850 [SAR86 cluster bacterium]